MAKNDNRMSAAVDQVKETLSESGHAAAVQAGEVKDQVSAVAALATAKAGKTLHRVADQLPNNTQELEIAARELAEKIRKNPRPWLIGAAVAAGLWLLARGRRRR